MRPFLWILSFFWLFSLSSQEFLQKKDIHAIIDQIMHQQGKKDLSSTILKRSYEIYLEQFDPDKRYLLASEVLAATALNSKDLQKFTQEFETIQSIVQKAILRSREIRKGLYATIKELIDEA